MWSTRSLEGRTTSTTAWQTKVQEELEGDSLQKRGPQQRQHPPEDSAQHAGDGCSREGGKQAVIHLPLILSFIIIIHLPLILSFIIIIHIVEPSRTQGTKSCKYRSIPGVVTVCSYPTEVTCEFCDRSSTIPYTSVSSVTVAPQYPILL